MDGDMDMDPEDLYALLESQSTIITETKVDLTSEDVLASVSTMTMTMTLTPSSQVSRISLRTITMGDNQ